MKRVSNLNPANLLTLTRIILVPVFFVLCFYAYRENGASPEDRLDRDAMHLLALISFLAIVTSDMADGYIARRYGLETELGILLDPLADKLFMTASFVLLAWFKQIPFWLTTIVVSKDVLLLVGWGMFFVLGINISHKPSKIGKICAVVQYATIFAVIINMPTVLKTWILWPTTGLLTAVAFIGYALRSLEKANSGKIPSNEVKSSGQ